MNQNQLTFIRKTDTLDSKGYKTFSLYACKCGNTYEAKTSRVLSGNTKSCGCLKKKPFNKSHGLRNHPLYIVWLNMRQRCSNPKVKCYPRYGGRGINVCEEWNCFEKFYSDVLPGYKKGLELDRIDGDKGYYLQNIQWLPHTENGRKRGYCKLNKEKASEIRNSLFTPLELADQYCVSIATIRKVLANKIWS